MIFTQSQQQAVLILIGLLLFSFSILAFVQKDDEPKLKEVHPILLEAKKEKKVFSPSKSSKASVRYQTRKKHQKPPQKTAAPAQNKYPHTDYQAVDLNSADSAALDAIPGIGPTLARRILKYRSLIGQFIEVEQLKLVYGLSLENYQRMAPHFVISGKQKIEKRDLNSEKSYRIAWFIGKEKSKLLVELRMEDGWFDRWERIEGANFLAANEVRWLKAYFFIKKRDTPEHVSSPK